MEPQPLEYLIRRHQLYIKLNELLDYIPEKIAEFHEDPAVADEPEVCELLAQLKAIGDRYSAISEELDDRLVEAMWHHLFQKHGIVKGDLVEVSYPQGGGYRLIVEGCMPSRYSDAPDDFLVFGKSALATGKPGKRDLAFPVKYPVWTKLELPKSPPKRSGTVDDTSDNEPENTAS